MSLGLVKHAALPGLSGIPSQTLELNATRQSTSWTDRHTSATNKLENHEPFNMSLGPTTNENEMRLGGFSQGSSLIPTDHWNRFSSHGEQAPQPVLPNYPFHDMSVSPDMRLPHSLPDPLRRPGSDTLQGPLPESFQHALHGPQNMQAPHPRDTNASDAVFPSYGNAPDDGHWLKNFDEFADSKSLGLHLSHPISRRASTNQIGLSSSLAASSTLPIPEHSYSHHQHSYPGMFPHSHSFSGSDRTTFKSKQPTPPQTASTSTTPSGSSSQYPKGDIFEPTTRKDTTWKHFDANANVFRSAPIYNPPNTFVCKPSYSAQEWKEMTCDPRGIIDKSERSDSRMQGPARGDAMLPMPSHSPAISDLSGSSASNEHSEGAGQQSRHNEFGTGMLPVGLVPIPSKVTSGVADARTAMLQRAKKSSEEEMLGMGLEDVDERALQFTSRQDTKPTRLLRRQCSNCRTWRDVSAWRRSIMQVGYIVCNKCGLYEKAHRKSRPLNDRGEFVRPAKHAMKLSAARVKGVRMRSASEHLNGLGVPMIRFGEDGPASAHQV